MLGATVGAAVAAIAYAPLETKSKWLLVCGAAVAYASRDLVRAMWKLRKVPGPLPLPLLGNVLSFANQEIHLTYAKWHLRYGKTFKWWAGPYPVIVTSDLEVVHRVGLRKFSQFKNHTPLPDHVVPLFPGEMKVMRFGMDVSRDLRWKGLRSTANSIFRSREVMSAFAPLMKASADALSERLGRVKEGESVDIWRALGDMTLDILGTTVFGVRFNSVQSEGSEAVEAARTIFRIRIASFEWNPYLALSLITPRFLTPLLVWLSRKAPTKTMKEADWAVGVLARLSEAMYEDAKRGLEEGTSDHQNFLKLFIDAHNRETGDLLTQDEVKAQAILFLLAGYETTANTLAYAIYLLTQNKEAEKKLIEEIDGLRCATPSLEELKSMVYLEGVVKESLRLYGPLPFTDRQASEEVELGGGVVALKDQIVLIDTRAMSLDEAYFPEPQRFLPERFVEGSEIYEKQVHRAHTPWGIGPRMCVAADFALAEAKLALITLYRRFTFEHDPKYEFKTSMAATLGPVNGVRVFVNKR
ncbi:cytochrome P450 [Chloropicon primus]|uniref:Cytochrome P450 n=1 Tax=Chloropicon primus TaxID=1764295 RepID=A0A5B8MHV9_9CHLO|nr:cytochrome P450 [Chloropicon primus]UPQ99428.1 cytochrome P450 [Chloropicon primus]|eukprot:QDZ20218.1 cytochrome P450 [Chloropicon primus]